MVGSGGEGCAMGHMKQLTYTCRHGIWLYYIAAYSEPHSSVVVAAAGVSSLRDALTDAGALAEEHAR